MKKIISVLFLVLVSIIITSCLTLPPGIKTSEYQAHKKTDSIPNINEVVTSELGETMLVSGTLKTYDVVHLLTSIEHDDTARGYNGGAFKVIIPSGMLKPKVTTNSAVIKGMTVKGTLYTAEGFKIRFPDGNEYSKEGGLLIADDDNNNAVWYLSSNRYLTQAINNISFKKEKITEWESNNFRQELVYNGVSEGKAHFIYREFIDGMIRDKFTQDITYNINNEKIIGFKGARFEIINANNIGIKYKVLKNFN